MFSFLVLPAGFTCGHVTLYTYSARLPAYGLSENTEQSETSALNKASVRL